MLGAIVVTTRRTIAIDDTGTWELGVEVRLVDKVEFMVSKRQETAQAEHPEKVVIQIQFCQLFRINAKPNHTFLVVVEKLQFRSFRPRSGEGFFFALFSWSVESFQRVLECHND